MQIFNPKIVMAFVIGLLATDTFAQSFFSNNDSNTKKTQPGPVIPPPNPVLTPDQFKNKVNTLSKQNDMQLNKQISDDLSRAKPAQSQAPIPPSNQQNDFSLLNQPATNQTQEGQPAPQNGPPFGTATGLPTPHNNAAPQQRTQTPTQNNTYTGFGGTTNTGTGTSNTGSSSGGWNIKY